MRSAGRLLWLAAIAALAAALVLSTPTGAGTTPAHAVVKTAYNKKLHRRIVVDGNGRTLYMFTGDVGGKPACTPQTLGASCVHQWPPLKSKRKPRAGAGIVASKLSVVTRTDKIKQAVYNRHPLYHYIGDSKPGDVYGQKYLGAWYVLTPKGTDQEVASAARTSPSSGKRPVSAFEKTSLPSAITSYWPLLPEIASASKPSPLNSAARLAARVS